jgi:hypothetical protein
MIKNIPLRRLITGLRHPLLLHHLWHEKMSASFVLYPQGISVIGGIYNECSYFNTGVKTKVWD